MGKRFNSDEMQKVFEILQESYDVYGPRIYQGTGCFSDTDVIRYGRLDSWEELVWDQKSDYSFKEALFPISETILYFTENEMKTADGAPRQRLIFLKSCDFHALKRLDEMYLKNGAEDYYYRRMRENTVFAVMGCKESGKNCFCVSMGTNRCEEYDMYIFQDEKGCYVELRCRELEELLWDNQLLQNWNRVIKIRAIDSYVGGNNIDTNGAGSGVTVEDNFYEFNRPKVNVRINISAGETEDTIFLGQDLNRYFTKDQQNKIFTQTGRDDR